MSHFGNSKHQVSEQHVAVTPCKILSYLHAQAQSNSLGLTFSPYTAERISTNRVQIALVSSYNRREKFITIG